MKNKKTANAYLKPLLLFIFIFAFWGLREFLSSMPPNLSEPVTVIHVIDGDTIEISSGITVRMIGVDTPESVHPDDTKTVSTVKGRQNGRLIFSPVNPSSWNMTRSNSIPTGVHLLMCTLTGLWLMKYY